MTTVYVPPNPTKNEIFHTIPKGINFDKYDKIDVIMTGDGKLPKKINSFDAANLDPKLLTNIKKKFRFTKPTPVQKCALPVVAADRDLMACAQTGSGKTVRYLFSSLLSSLCSGKMCVWRVGLDQTGFDHTSDGGGGEAMRMKFTIKENSNIAFL